MDITKIYDSTASDESSMAGFCEHDIETWVPINVAKLLKQLTTFSFPRKTLYHGIVTVPIFRCYHE
jgi:hypothetical protein